MLIYNTSYMFDASFEEAFCQWMKEKYIPLLKETGTFVNSFFCKVMVKKEDNGITYSLQLHFKDQAHFERYLEKFEPKTEAIFKAKYQNYVLTFSSLLQEI